jgi:hypothetical protein
MWNIDYGTMLFYKDRSSKQLLLFSFYAKVGLFRAFVRDFRNWLCLSKQLLHGYVPHTHLVDNFFYHVLMQAARFDLMGQNKLCSEDKWLCLQITM